MVDSQDCPSFTSDLLQQAFEDVMNNEQQQHVDDDGESNDDEHQQRSDNNDEEDHHLLASILAAAEGGIVEEENNCLLLASRGTSSSASAAGEAMITLTSARAAALGLTLEQEAESWEQSQQQPLLWGQSVLLQNASVIAPAQTSTPLLLLQQASPILAQEIPVLEPIVKSNNCHEMQTNQVYQAIPLTSLLQTGCGATDETTTNNNNDQIFHTLNGNIFTTTPTAWKNHMTKNSSQSSLKIKTVQANHSALKNANNNVVAVNANHSTSFNSIPILKNAAAVNGHTQQQQNKNNTFSKSVLQQNKTANKPSNIIINRQHFAEKIIAKTTDATKPLGSTENPIHIVQQGKSFHSTQNLPNDKLNKMMLQQLLQTRRQSATNPSDTIVYRLVLAEETAASTVANTFQNHQASKRGRPRKQSLLRHSTNYVVKSRCQYQGQDESKEDGSKKAVARTRSGRLSRPPRHMVRDYKHLRPKDLSQQLEPGDSDGGYSDYNSGSSERRQESSESPPKLLAGLEMPKRNISEDFRCPTCNKIYLGRFKMARHFEAHPDHGSPSRLLPPPSSSSSSVQEEQPKLLEDCPLKRKGKKRGPWAYVTPEAKSERRQGKLREAIEVCEDFEIAKVAAGPVLQAMSMYKLLLLRSRNSVDGFLDELKTFLDDVRNNVGPLLALAEEVKAEGEVLELQDERVRVALGGVEPGRYKLVRDIFEREEKPETLLLEQEDDDAPAHKRKKPQQEQQPPRVVECPEVLSALTLIPRIVESSSEPSNSEGQPTQT